MQNKVRPISIYLPQFHPIPENDEWWGKGFTEWTNVVKAKSRFKGHQQPHLPADLGFYDLRLNEVMQEQALLAKQHGIYGFCYYHYWFNGKRLLNRPLDDLIKYKAPNYPFMLCWANENWTRRWDGRNNDILIGQDYSISDHRDHIRFLGEKFFSDDRYITIDGKPVFIVYRTELIPDVARCTEAWRQEARKMGFKDLYLVRVESFKTNDNPGDAGFDASMEFQPNWKRLPKREKPSLLARFIHKVGLKEDGRLINKVFDYNKLANLALTQNEVAYKYFRCVTPMWDNSARRERDATIFINSTPKAYGDWLYKTMENFKPYSEEENFVFINAWNEWAEGNHLEPCKNWGKEYLRETKEAISKSLK